MSLRPSDLRKGLKILWEGIPFEVTEFQFVKPGKGSAMYKCRLRDMLSGRSQEKTFREVESFEKPDLEDREIAFSYINGEMVVFTDPDNYEEISIPESVMGKNKLL